MACRILVDGADSGSGVEVPVDDATAGTVSEPLAAFEGIDLASFHGGGEMPPGSAEACPFLQAAAELNMDPERLMDLVSQLVKSATPDEPGAAPDR